MFTLLSNGSRVATVVTFGKKLILQAFDLSLDLQQLTFGKN